MSGAPAASDDRTTVVLASDFFLRYTAALARGLADVGARVALLTRDHDEEFGHVPGAMHRHVGEVLGDAATLLELPGRVRDPRGALAAARMFARVRRLAPDVVHYQDGVAIDPRLILATARRPGRYALTVHDPVRHPGDRPPRGYIERSRRALIRRAGLIFVHADALRDELRAVEGVDAPVVVVPHGVEESSSPPLPEQPSILFFGRLSYYKGVDTLLDALPLIWERQPEVTLTIAGYGPPPEHALLSDPRVRLRHEHVPDDDVPALFGSATVVALPYRQASQSGVGSLAKRYGRAIVATDVGGLPELVAGGSGLLAPPEDPPALAEALAAVLGDRERAAAMGRAAAASGAADASWPAVAERTLAAYREHLLR